MSVFSRPQVYHLADNFNLSLVGGMNQGNDHDSNAFLDDTVFIQGLPPTVTEESLAKHFAAVGSLKVR